MTKSNDGKLKFKPWNPGDAFYILPGPSGIHPSFQRHYISKMNINDFAILWERFEKFPEPLELKGVEYGRAIRRVFKTLIFSGDTSSIVNAKFANELETDIYSVIGLHKSMKDRYARQYTWAIYQMSRGVQALFANNREFGEVGRWYELIKATLDKLDVMVE